MNMQTCFAKITRSPFAASSASTAQQIASNLAKLEAARQASKEASVQKWRDKMKTFMSQCNMTYVPFQGLVSANLEHTTATASVAESLRLIKRHWRQIWSRQERLGPATFQAIDSEINRLPNRVPMLGPFSAMNIFMIVPSRCVIKLPALTAGQALKLLISHLKF